MSYDHVRPPDAATPTLLHSRKCKRGSTYSEVAGLSKQSSELLKGLLILLIKPVFLSAIDVDDSHDLVDQSDRSTNALEARATHLAFLDDRHNNLALTGAIACNVPWELFDIRHELRLHSLCRSATNTAPKRDGLACYLAVEWTEQQLLRVRRVEEVESTPIDAGRRSGQRVVCVPEEGRCVREVASHVS
jgi:hypothetical protein